jgi:hypothetical protein
MGRHNVAPGESHGITAVAPCKPRWGRQTCGDMGDFLSPLPWLKRYSLDGFPRLARRGPRYDAAAAARNCPTIFTSDFVE